jgi:hypothetical protein
MDINESITEKQYSMLCYLLGPGRSGLDLGFLPESWKNLPGKPVGEHDWREWNLMRWMKSSLSKKAASATITALSEFNAEGAKALLISNGCPTI